MQGFVSFGLLRQQFRKRLVPAPLAPAAVAMSAPVAAAAPIAAAEG
jgi:hypothetical protein